MNTSNLQSCASFFFVAGSILLSAPLTYAQSYLQRGNSFLESTYFNELSQDTTASIRARELRGGGFETSNGAYVNLNRWYSPQFLDTRVSWITQVTPKLSILWGVSTGEKAEKYTIKPGLKLGFLYQTKLNKKSVLSLSATTYIGGELNEKTCIADYGDIGGVHEVNCRLAATTMAPEETLNYLVQAKPVNTWYIQYTFYF